MCKHDPEGGPQTRNVPTLGSEGHGRRAQHCLGKPLEKTEGRSGKRGVTIEKKGKPTNPEKKRAQGLIYGDLSCKKISREKERDCRTNERRWLANASRSVGEK